jgi:hypothetical protein
LRHHLNTYRYRSILGIHCRKNLADRHLGINNFCLIICWARLLWQQPHPQTRDACVWLAIQNRPGSSNRNDSIHWHTKICCCECNYRYKDWKFSQLLNSKPAPMQYLRLQNFHEALSRSWRDCFHILLFDKFFALLYDQRRNNSYRFLRQCRFTVQWLLSA